MDVEHWSEKVKKKKNRFPAAKLYTIYGHLFRDFY